MIFLWIFFEIICKTINRFSNWGVTRSNVDEIIFFKKNYISSTCIVNNNRIGNAW